MNKKNIAAIDLGTNSFHMVIVCPNDNGGFEILDREREVIRLGEGNKGDLKIISEDALLRSTNTLKRFKGIADSKNAQVRAVATSAVREAKNKYEFISRVKKEAGIDIEVISGVEEARLIYLGILQSVPVYSEKTLCVDIGGGSTEFVVGERGRIFFTSSLKLGAVRLTQMFFPNGKINKESINKCRDWVRGELVSVKYGVGKIGFGTVVGSSGTIITAATMSAGERNTGRELPSILNNYTFTKDDLSKVEKKVLKLKTTEERKNLTGLEAKRADIIPAGLIILSEIFKELNINIITVSAYALREGIIQDTIEKRSAFDSGKEMRDIRRRSIKQLTDSSNFDKNHCEYVSRLALKLFDELAPLHNLGKNERIYLEAAAILHDIGFHIGHTRHHIHSEYIIKNSELVGFTENEINIIAAVARYHRKSHPKKSHPNFASLSHDSKMIVRKLASILRVADSLDRTHQKVIKDINVEISNDRVILHLTAGEKDFDIELWNFERRRALFEDVYGKEIKVAPEKISS